MLRIILSLIIAAHGIGHSLFLIPLLGVAEWGQSTRSWLITGTNEARVIGGILWLVAMIGFGLSAYGLWNQQEWWRNGAIIASVVSTLGLILFWATPVSSPVISALIFNLLVLGALLLLHFPSIEAVGA